MSTCPPFFHASFDRTGTTFLPFFHTSLSELEQLLSYFPDRTGPPPDVPECGFDGGLCERDSQVRRAWQEPDDEDEEM